VRAFWDEEGNPLVAQLLDALLDYTESEIASVDNALLAECRKIVLRLKQGQPVAEMDAIARIADEHDLEVVAKAVLDNINKNELVVGASSRAVLKFGWRQTDDYAASCCASTLV
jgi:hypothetical protein